MPTSEDTLPPPSLVDRRPTRDCAPVATQPPALIALGIAATGGWLTNLAFPDRGWWPLAYVGMACLLLAMRGAGPVRAGAIGLVWGLAFFLPHVHWALQATGSVLPWMALSLFQAPYVAVFGALWVWARRATWLEHRPLAQAGTAAVLWVAVEQVRGSWPFGGFPWGVLAFSQTDAPLLRLAPYGGGVLVSAFVVAIGALLAMFIQQLHRTTMLAAGGALLGAVVFAVTPGLLPLYVGEERGSLRVGAVQGNVPQQGANWADQAREVTANHRAGTERLAAAAGTRRLDLVVWPESAADIDPRTDPAQAAFVDAAAAAVDAPLLLGAQRFPDGEDTRFNEIVSWQAGDGAVATYAKQHPVPFGEYVPYRQFFRQITPLVDRITTDMAAGTDPALLSVPIERLAREVRFVTAICFEVAYGDLVREGVLAGGELIIIPTNNASFGRTQESTQQLAMSRFRAAEHGRATIQISTVGVSAMIMPDGSVLNQTGLFTAEELIATLPLRTTLTPAARLRTAPALGAYLLAAAAVIAGALASLDARPCSGRRWGRRRPRVRPQRRPLTESDTATRHGPSYRRRESGGPDPHVDH